jgi:hypothetical protein
MREGGMDGVREGEKGEGQEYCICQEEKEGGDEKLKREGKKRKQQHRREELVVNSATEIDQR